MKNNQSMSFSSTAPRFRYEEVAYELRQLITGGEFEYGQQLDSEDILAQKYEITRQTLRKALGLLEEEGIILRQKGRGTFVSYSNEKKQVSQVLYIGCYSDHFFKDLYSALQRECQENDLSLAAFDPLISNDNNHERLQRLVNEADLVVCFADRFEYSLPIYQESDCQWVILEVYDKNKNELPLYSISCDQFRAGVMATEHLLSLGHKHIACLGVWPDTQINAEFPPPNYDNNAYMGYRHGMLKDGNLETCAFGYHGGVSEETISLLERYLWHLDGWATAFVCDADQRGVTLLHAAARLGLKVPEDISIVGLFNTPWAESSVPTLTSISLNESEMAKVAIKMLNFDMPKKHIRLRIEPEIIIRNSTMPLQL